MRRPWIDMKISLRFFARIAPLNPLALLWETEAFMRRTLGIAEGWQARKNSVGS
jgi:hypothetical protein